MRALLVAGRVECRGPTTVIAEPKVILPLAVGSYTEAAHAKSMTTTRILVGWSEDCAELLQIAPGEAAKKLECVFSTHLPVTTDSQVLRTSRRVRVQTARPVSPSFVAVPQY